MKKLLYIALLFVLVACEDKYEIAHRYNRPYNIFKDYPIYLDASEILVDIQVKPSINPDNAFKIVSNGNYYFVGEKMKGIHVFDKTGNPLCFIECKYLKAFDIADNMLYCNNFVDLLVIDVKNPLNAKIEHREKDYFNKYYNSSYNSPYYSNYPVAGVDVYYVGNKRIVLEGIETDANPAPDFSEYDQLYTNFIVKGIPDDIQLDRPYVGFANVEGNIFTFGFNSLAQCSYTSGEIRITQWGTNFLNYTLVMPTSNLQYKDGMILVIGNNGFWYLDYHNIMTQSQNHYSQYNLFDVVSLKGSANSFAMVSNHGGSFKGTTLYFIIGQDFWGWGQEFWYTKSLINVNDIVFDLGNHLRLYAPFVQDVTYEWFMLKYPNISGSCMLKDDNILAVANQQGLLLYDITDLENITLIP